MIHIEPLIIQRPGERRESGKSRPIPTPALTGSGSRVYSSCDEILRPQPPLRIEPVSICALFADAQRRGLVSHPWWVGEFVLPQKFRIEQFAVVAASRVTQNGDDGVTRTHVLGHGDCASDVDSSGTAHG